jgi:ataxia telangiectasia mutated family protein
MGRLHPHHCLYQIFCLKHGNRISRSVRSADNVVEQDPQRTKAAEQLLRKLRGVSDEHARLLDQMGRLLDGYLELSEDAPSDAVWQSKQATISAKMRRLKNLDLLPVPTVDLVPRTDARYDVSGCYVRDFEVKITTPGGINRPMKLICRGSDGHNYIQLLKAMNAKGGDDLRQDAVMEQVFGVANTLLQNNRETRERSLRVRTYKVVPMTPSVGVIEWCDNTMPVGHYLLGPRGAHRRYRPQDWTDVESRNKMKIEQEKGDKASARRKYTEVCNHFRPVLHHFFIERYPRPADWFERRLAYTRSVATSSIVGYVMGLGDRHTQNMLLDLGSADVIHIDLGVAFEQGKLRARSHCRFALPLILFIPDSLTYLVPLFLNRQCDRKLGKLLKTPETVPFRLTRDIVDGMGVNGVEGAFTRSAEQVARHCDSLP